MQCSVSEEHGTFSMNSKRFGHGPNQPSQTGSILLRAKPLEKTITEPRTVLT